MQRVADAEHGLVQQRLAGVPVGRRRHARRPLRHTLVGALVVQQPEGGRPGSLVRGVPVTVPWRRVERLTGGSTDPTQLSHVIAGSPAMAVGACESDTGIYDSNYFLNNLLLRLTELGIIITK